MLKTDIEARDEFLFTLKWILAVSKRYVDSSLHFGLAHICLENHQQLGDTYGAQEASRRLIEMSQVLRSSFRETDLVARDGLDYWILAPYTPASENLTDKIMSILAEASKNGLDVTDRNIAIYSLPLKEPLKEEAESPQSFLYAIKSMCEAKACDFLCGERPCLKVSLQAAQPA